MAALSFQTHLSFFSFFILIILTRAEAELNLDSSDRNAFLTIQKDLGITGQRHALSLTCNFPGLFCERRISNRSYVLRITRIVFNSQQLKGSLSPAIGKLTELRELSLPNNQLVDRIALQLITCRKLEILNLRNNSFSGHVPSELSSLTRLRIIDFSSNKFSGNLNFLEHFPNLEKLSLANNSFSGKVPTSLKSFPKLKFVDFSGNNYLESPIPKRIKYPASDLADRNDIPRRYVLQENNTTRRGNQSHSTAMAPKASRNSSDNSTHAPPPTKAYASHKHKKAKKTRVWIFGFLAGTAAGSISGFVIAMVSRLLMDMIRGRVKNSGLVIFSPMIKKAEDLAFLEKEDGLASLELIGKGGCGEVYKAELPGSNGKMIAIKKIVQPPKDAADLTDEDSKLLNKKMRQIKSEIQTVGQIRHRNLVPLLAHLSRPDCHMLVYEFMKNGSLQDVLEQVSQGTRELDWPARHRIAMGVVSGLQYLHLHTQRIIHRDLKPANILLDNDMEARIADFGLAKAIPEAQTHVTTSNVAGTVGYIAPEYHQTLKFTDKCDIYSYGVLLGALVIGKLPSDEFFQHTAEMSLVKWMRNVMTSDDPRRAIDPKLMGSGHEEQVLLALKIAIFCTLDSPKERPSSNDIRCMLSQIKV